MVLALVVLSLFAAYSVYLNDTNQKQIANYRSILDSAGREPVAEAAKPLPEDTISQIKPIITDTALLQTDTNVDSLQKEYEKQMAKPAATVETPPVAGNTKSSEPILESQGKKYRLPKSAIYFYDSPNSESAKRGVLGLWSNTKFSVTDQQNDFIYVTHTNNSGEVTRGWLKLSDLNELP
jgi:serine/threonine-protein kinase